MEKDEKLNRFNLQERLIAFAVLIVEIVEGMPVTKVSSHLGGQLLCSGTSTSLNYGEAQSGESRKDFIHKMKIGFKELRETNICLKIIAHTKQFGPREKIAFAINESNELISNFVKSVKTA